MEVVTPSTTGGVFFLELNCSVWYMCESPFSTRICSFCIPGCFNQASLMVSVTQWWSTLPTCQGTSNSDTRAPGQSDARSKAGAEHAAGLVPRWLSCSLGFKSCTDIGLRRTIPWTESYSTKPEIYEGFKAIQFNLTGQTFDKEQWYWGHHLAASRKDVWVQSMGSIPTFSPNSYFNPSTVKWLRHVETSSFQVAVYNLYIQV